MAEPKSKDINLYRPAAGICLFNTDGKVFLGRRAGSRTRHVWQFPQGGIDAGETPLLGAMRELEEETGVKAQHIKSLGMIDDWLFYDFPKGFTGSKAAKGWHGQRQLWYAFRFTGKSKHIDLKAHKDIEFSDWRWGTLAEAEKLIVPFKRKVYARVAREFARFESPEHE